MTELQESIRKLLDAAEIPAKPRERIMEGIAKQEGLAQLRREIRCTNTRGCECDQHERDRICCYWSIDTRVSER